MPPRHLRGTAGLQQEKRRRRAAPEAYKINLTANIRRLAGSIATAHKRRSKCDHPSRLGQMTKSKSQLSCSSTPRRLLAAAFTLTFAMLSGGAQAQAYPQLPVRFIVPYPAGAGTAIAARLLARRIVEKAPGIVARGLVVGSEASRSTEILELGATLAQYLLFSMH